MFQMSEHVEEIIASIHAHLQYAKHSSNQHQWAEGIPRPAILELQLIYHAVQTERVG